MQRELAGTGQQGLPAHLKLPAEIARMTAQSPGALEDEVTFPA